MKECPRCGKQIDDNEYLCSDCVGKKDTPKKSILSLAGFIITVTSPLNAILFNFNYFLAIVPLSFAGLIVSIVGLVTAKIKRKSLWGFGLAGIIIAASILGTIIFGVFMFFMFHESPPQSTMPQG